MGSMISLAVIIVLVSGLIAYIGDLVGRKMGRKRLTLMGLRPKHTAIVISVSVGMLIALLTLLTMLGISKGVRDAFFTPLGKLKAELVTQRKAIAVSSVQLQDARKQIKQTHDLLAAQNSELAAKNLEITRKTQELRKTNLRLAASTQQRRLIERRLRAERSELARLNTEYTRVSGDLRASRAQLTRLRRQIDELKDQLKSGEESLVRVNEAIRASMKEEYRLQDSLAQLHDQVQVLTTFARGSFSPLSFTSGQEILSGLVPVSGTADERKALLASFFAAAETVVHQRSVDLSKDAKALLLLTGEKDRLRQLTINDAIEQLLARIDRITGTDGVIVRLTPVNNVPLDSPALVAVDRIELTPNAPAYSTGAEVAAVEMTISPQTTTADVLGRLADSLLRERMPTALRARGMVSITRRFDPDHPTAIPEPSTPTVSWAELLAAAEKARRFQGRVRLIARAHSSVSLYGPLAVDLDVVPVQ